MELSSLFSKTWWCYWTQRPQSLLWSCHPLSRKDLFAKDYPLQYSCLENSTEREAWWATGQGSQSIRHDWWLTFSLFIPHQHSQSYSLLSNLFWVSCHQHHTRHPPRLSLKFHTSKTQTPTFSNMVSIFLGNTSGALNSTGYQLLINHSFGKKNKDKKAQHLLIISYAQELHKYSLLYFFPVAFWGMYLIFYRWGNWGRCLKLPVWGRWLDTGRARIQTHGCETTKLCSFNYPGLSPGGSHSLSALPIWIAHEPRPLSESSSISHHQITLPITPCPPLIITWELWVSLVIRNHNIINGLIGSLLLETGSLLLTSLSLNALVGDFPGGPVVKTSPFYVGGEDLILAGN